MRQSQRFVGMLKVFGLLFGGIIVLVVAMLAAGELWGATAYLISIPIYLILFALLMVYAFRGSNRAAYPPVLDEARQTGLLMPARVLEIKRTRWRRTRGRGFLRPWRESGYSFGGFFGALLASGSVEYRAWEHILRVQVQPHDAPPYEATFSAYIESGEKPPKKGATIEVKVHPRQPDVVVLANEAELSNEPRG